MSISVDLMIGIVLVTHGRLAEELLAATQHIVGPLDNVRTVCIGPEDDMEQRRSEITAAISAVDVGHGVVLSTNTFRSPSVALKLRRDCNE